MFSNIKYLILFLLLNSCEPFPPCTKSDATDKPGIYSKILGTVQIDGESCTIIETYEKYNCADWGWDYSKNRKCLGHEVSCQWKILTRITKCPSGSSTNSITHTTGKFSHEVVR